MSENMQKNQESGLEREAMDTERVEAGRVELMQLLEGVPGA